MRTLAAAALTATMFPVGVRAQAPATPPREPAFDVVSIKPNQAGGFGLEERPDGGVTMINVPVTTLLARAYRLEVDLTALPEWATQERFDVQATASRKGATREERDAMVRAMLADRFKLVAHIEDREYDTYDLVLAREDGRLGPGLKKVDVDCVAVQAEREAARVAALAAGLQPPTPVGRTGPLPPCFLRSVADRQNAARMEGQTTMDNFAAALQFTTRPRQVVNKTGLTGSFELTLDFDATPMQSGPALAPPAPGSQPALFTALQEQLGLRLVSSRTRRPTVIVDRIERPTEN